MLPCIARTNIRDNRNVMQHMRGWRVQSTYSNHVCAEYALAILITVDVPLFPGCSGEEERWHWSWVRSTDLRCPHHHHWPGQSTASSRLAPSGHSLHFTNHIGCIGNFSCICSTEFGFHCDTDMHSIDTATRWPARVHIPVHLINLSLLILAIISCAAPPIAPLPADRMAARSETTHW